ncbi:MAG: GH92 family glycosyl hydrolase [Melioribacteraceae bacterium]|nr:GH92 family glycosyl hydrolase [Melioribacteraceae bacterium]
MINKRIILFAIAFVYTLSLSGCETQMQKSEISYVDLVQPLMGTIETRWFYFSSASRPFGMVNLNPDNLVSETWKTGYDYSVDSIRGFSHIHAWQLSGISIMPVVGDVDPTKGANDYGSPYSHEKEKVKPGYHYVELDRYDIKAEVTSTKRVGFHRYTFPKSSEAKVFFNLGGQLGPSYMEDGFAKKVSATEIEGFSVNAPTRRRPKHCPVFFVAQLNSPMKEFDFWKGSEILYDENEISGENVGAILQFNSEENQELLIKVGISYVSIEQARLNLETELSHWDFDKTVQESFDEWNEWLGKIDVEGATLNEQQRFYTDLWHALQGRRTISDVNGKYSDFTGDERRIKQIPLDENNKPLFNHYNSDSYWGAQWTLNTLWHLVYPKVSQEFINSMMLMYEDGGLIPRGPSGGNYTYVMVGAHSTPFIVSAYQKGIRGFDIERVYEGLRKNHLPGGIMAKAGYEHNTWLGGGLEHYIKNGFVPYPLPEKVIAGHQDGAGQTLEYAYQDWTLAQMANSLGKEDDYKLFMKRSENYTNIFDSGIGWMRPKNVDGQFRPNYDPLTYDEGWVESNGAQATYFVPHDVKGLIDLLGGNEKFTDRLNLAFEMSIGNGFIGEKPHREVYVNYGNQPSTQMANLFNYSGAPWLTQHWTREIVNTVFSSTLPDGGYSGDEDQGLMGSLAVLLRIGLFEMNGGCSPKPFYEIGSPVFDKITITLDEDFYSGKFFVIETENNSKENRYIQKVELDGEDLNKPWFFHSDLVDGGTLKIRMGSEPNKNWGSISDAAPPSKSSNN